MNILVDKVKEVLYSVLPITIIALILHFTLTPLEPSLLIRFLFGAVLIIIGLALFLLGVDIGVTPIGHLMGSNLTKSAKVWVTAAGGLILGFLISIAEPDLHILAGQVDFVTSGLISKFSIVTVVSIGIAAMIASGLLRIVYNVPLYKMLTVLYLVIFGLALLSSSEFLAIAFDASGATTGALTVPFMLALSLGVSSMRADSKAAEKDSFGLVAIASAGAIIAVMAMGIIFNVEKLSGSLEYTAPEPSGIVAPFLEVLPPISGEIFIALMPLTTLYLFFQKRTFHLPHRASRKIIVGLIYTFIGLVLFLTGVNAGFMDVGTVIGYGLASLENKSAVVIVGFILGLLTILAEPAVHVLTHQIEDVTSGYVKRKIVLVALSLGVGVAVALSIIRIIVPGIQLWHYLLPGYVIAIIMTYLVPKLFVGIAFDSGGVASGPMTATFILAFAQGTAEAIEGADVLLDGFGVISMVALTPLIALQVLGAIFKAKSRKSGVEISENS